MMKSSLRPPTTAEKRYHQELRDAGCVLCWIGQRHGLRRTWMAIEVHHLLSGGHRISHRAVLNACHYHHQADFFPSGCENSSYSSLVPIYGPSLKRSPGQFRTLYGSDSQLIFERDVMLARLQAGEDLWA